MSFECDGLDDCSDCYRPERKRPGGLRTLWESADFARRTSNSGDQCGQTITLLVTVSSSNPGGMHSA